MLRRADPARRGRGAAVRADRWRGGIGQEPPRARVRRARPPPAGRWCSTAPATRSCAARTGRSSRRSTSSCAVTDPERPACRRSGPRAASYRACSRTCPSCVGELPPPLAPTRTPSATACTRAVARAAGGGRSAGAAGAGDRGRSLGRHPDAAAAAPPSRGASGARALLVTTFRDTEAEVPEALSAALVDLRRSEGVVRMRLGGLELRRGRLSLSSSAGRREPRPGDARGRAGPARA